MIDYDPHRWWDHFWDLRGTVLRGIALRVFVCVAWAFAVCFFHFNVHRLDIPSTAHSLVGVALGLLLVFRTNASYDRFWEGRKMWGGMVNETRNLARASTTLLSREPQLVDEIARWTAAFAWSSMHMLRGTKGLGDISASLPAEEVRLAMESNHPPLAVATRISRLIAQARERGLIGEYQQMTLDNNVQLLIDYVGACERIQKTPLPFAYVVHLRRALLLYLYTLPTALVKDFGWMAMAALLLIGYTFLGIEEIGVEIENPFGFDDNDLPLERICATIEANVTQLR